MLNHVARSVIEEIRTERAKECAKKTPLTLPFPPARGWRGNRWVRVYLSGKTESER